MVVLSLPPLALAAPWLSEQIVVPARELRIFGGRCKLMGPCRSTPSLCLKSATTGRVSHGSRCRGLAGTPGCAVHVAGQWRPTARMHSGTIRAIIAEPCCCL